MLDIRDRPTVLAALREARRTVEKGGSPSVVARDLLRELAGALADSGPSELGVLPELWLDALAAADRGVASLSGGFSPTTYRQTKRSIRELQLFFGRRLTWRRAVMGWICAVYVVIFLICLPFGIVAMGNDNPVVFVVIAALVGGVFVLSRYRTNSREVTTRLDLPDRILFIQVVEAPRGEVKSRLRTVLGMYAHPVLIATDRRLVMARAASEAAAKDIGAGIRGGVGDWLRRDRFVSRVGTPAARARMKL